MRGGALLLSLVASLQGRTSLACTSDLNCSLNGLCGAGGSCACDRPWGGSACGELLYATTPRSGKSLYPETDPRNTWNGAILRDGPVYHLYAPLYPAGSLGGATKLMHGVASQPAGPYNWSQYPDMPIPLLAAFDGPKSVVYTQAGQTKHSLWLGGRVYLSESAAGPFRVVENFSYPGHNPAPVWHNGTFYTIVSMAEGIYSTSQLRAGGSWRKHAEIALDGVPASWLPEDPDMFVDKRGNWHIVNHAYDNHEWRACASSVLSSHFFSPDGISWHFLPIQPYSHTVQYDDGSSHMFVTLERPTLLFDRGQLTHIHLAADLDTGDEGCGNRTEHAHFGHTPCDNCKYGDHGGTTIIALDTII